MTQIDSAYILCSNPRSGTTLLCDMLTQTGVAGHPDSFLRQPSLSYWAKTWGVTGPFDRTNADFSARYFAAMQKAGSHSGTFGMRLMGEDLDAACVWLDRHAPEQASDRARLETIAGPLRFIHLSRHDKLAEAISYVRAEQTGLWHQNADGSDHERIAPNGADGYDRVAIAARIDVLQLLDQAWTDWFAAQNITPLSLSYEALADDPAQRVADVLSYIGRDPSLAKGVTPKLRKLADDVSATWIAKYRAEQAET